MIKKKNEKAKVLSVSNQKGGVGKTTTSINLATSLSILGKEVLLVDFDPQANATSGLGIKQKDFEYNIYHSLLGEKSVKDVIKSTMIPQLKIIPATVDLSGAEVELVNSVAREMKLKNALKEILYYFDYIIIDCPPSLGLLTINALVAADSVIIPLQCEYYALEGLSQLLKTIAIVRESLNKSLHVEGIVPTMYDIRNNISKQVINEVREHFKSKVFETIIPRNVRLSEAPSFGKPVFVYDRNSKGTVSYLHLAQELLNKAVAA